MGAMHKLMKSISISLIAVLFGLALAPAVSAEVIKVPPGNRNDKRPNTPALSKLWTTFISRKPYELKYRRVYGMLQRDKVLISKIKQVSAIYGIDPIHVVGAIVGEHTFNVDGYDSLQRYYVKAAKYVNLDMSFSYKGETADQFFKRPQFKRCSQYKTDYEVWDCRSVIWTTQFRGKTVGGKHFANERIQLVFFKPGIAGLTFGLGQMSPVAVLMVNEYVHEKGGLPLLDMNRANEVYNAVMDPDKTIHYMAAHIRISIDLYRNIAGFDISGNPGLTATLYNLGDVATRARQLKAENDRRKQRGQPIVYPEENFYGWLVNDRTDELRKLL
jgi:Protein of unknown function (DUF1402)